MSLTNYFCWRFLTFESFYITIVHCRSRDLSKIVILILHKPRWEVWHPDGLMHVGIWKQQVLLTLHVSDVSSTSSVTRAALRPALVRDGSSVSVSVYPRDTALLSISTSAISLALRSMYKWRKKHHLIQNWWHGALWEMSLVNKKEEGYYLEMKRWTLEPRG